MWFLFALGLGLGCSSTGVLVSGTVAPAPDGDVFLAACQKGHPTTEEFKKALGGDCDTTWSRLSTARAIDITKAPISDLAPLSGLVNLVVFTAYDNAIKDIGPLAKLVHLEEIYLVSNHIEDVRPLKDMLLLRVLRLDGNHIKDISSLKGLSRLENLGLDRNRIEDFMPLQALERVRSLNTNHNPVDPSKCPLEGNGPKQLYKYCKRMHKHFNNLQDAFDPKEDRP